MNAWDTPSSATGGALFNRNDPRDASGETKPILDRNLAVRNGVHNYVANEGRDFTGLSDSHRLKYRIPDTSVVNKVGDCGCCGLHLTAAQWIWILNLVCFVAHTTMVIVVAYFAWISKDLDKYGDENPHSVKIYRVTAKWTNSTVEGYDMAIESNGMPIDLAWGVLSFFLISAVFHLFSVVCGLFECFWVIYFRQLDDCFAFWRWIEYSISCSLMGVLLAITLGIREQNTLACCFSLLWVTNMLGLLNELYSRPVMHPDRTNYQNPVGRRSFTGKPDYNKNPNALYLINQAYWEGDRMLRDGDGKPTGDSTFETLYAKRGSNFIKRQIPYILGWFPFMTYIVIIVYHLEFQKWQLREETNGEIVIPAWVDAIIYGTVILFASFAAVMPIFQYLPPGMPPMRPFFSPPSKHA